MCVRGMHTATKNGIIRVYVLEKFKKNLMGGIPHLLPVRARVKWFLLICLEYVKDECNSVDSKK